jgi:hypothetical protein
MNEYTHNKINVHVLFNDLELYMRIDCVSNVDPT